MYHSWFHTWPLLLMYAKQSTVRYAINGAQQHAQTIHIHVRSFVMRCSDNTARIAMADWLVLCNSDACCWALNEIIRLSGDLVKVYIRAMQ